MLRIRDSRGKLIPIPTDAAVIEICSIDGKVGRLLMLIPEGIAMLDHHDPEFHQYCRSLKLDKAEHIQLDVDKETGQGGSLLTP